MGYRCRCCSEEIPQADSVCPKCGYNNGADTMEAVLAEMLRLYGQKEFLTRADMVNVFGDLAPELRDERLMLKYLYEVDGLTELFASIGRPAAEAQLLVNRVISRLKSKFISEQTAREICDRFLTAVGGSIPPTPVPKPPKIQKWVIPAITFAALLALVIGGVAIFGGQDENKTDSSTQPEAVIVDELVSSPVPTLVPTVPPISEPTPVPTSEPTPEPTIDADPPSADTISTLGENIRYPKSSSYLPVAETMYVKSNDGHSIFLYWAPMGGVEYRRSHYLYEGDQVSVIAREGNFSCVVYTTETGNTFAGWVYTQNLVYEQ